MNRIAGPAMAGALAFVSGTPALIYQVVWTRQIGLIAGGQIEAISVVLVAFFGGLAIGNHLLGRLADRTPTPLRLYGVLEIASAVMAAASVLALRRLAEVPSQSEIWLLGASAALLMPVTILLGGTLPALLQWIARSPRETSSRAGWLVGANTLGAVMGVSLATAGIPAIGLRASLFVASGIALCVGLTAVASSRAQIAATRIEDDAPAIPPAILATAFVVGVATLGFEVLAARLATLRLGSSLYAWALVLALFLIGLAAGNLALARRARVTSTPQTDLGTLEIGAACSIGLGLAILRPEFGAPAAALDPRGLALVAIAVLPATFFMGGAFPILVRLCVRSARAGSVFGRLSAINTLGGIVGALLAPFVLLPLLGSVSSGLTLAAVNAAVGVVFLGRGDQAGRGRRSLIAVLCLGLAVTPVLRSSPPLEDPWVLAIHEGRQGIAVVTGSWGDRTLVVDGDPEASTAGNARQTEEFLAVLPILLHPEPTRFLEVGLGSGITLGTVSRFPLERIDCVEISPSVIRSAIYFEPDNRGVASSDAVRIFHSDARRLLATTRNVYDVISANTLHPWSIGATGLYSREYFARVAGALREGGIAVQWLPTEQIGVESLSLILRTFFDVFPHGGLWWGAGNIVALGTLAPVGVWDANAAARRLANAEFSPTRFGWTDPSELSDHFIADADDVRSVLGDAPLLTDDRPMLELHAARGRVLDHSGGALYRRLARIAQVDAGHPGMLFWLESLALRADGDALGADSREALAIDQGFTIARRARIARIIDAAHVDALQGHLDAAGAGFDAALRVDPANRYALFGRAGLALRHDDLAAAIVDLEAIVTDWPEESRAWNELAGAQARLGDLDAADESIDAALRANPFDLRSLANAGLIAIQRENPERARDMLERIRELSPLGQSPQEKVLASALDRRPSS